MSGERLVAKLRQVYSRCAHDVDSWVQAKARIISVWTHSSLLDKLHTYVVTITCAAGPPAGNVLCSC